MAMAGKAAGPKNDEWLDCNVTLGQWPFRKTAFQTPKSLAEKLQKRGVTQAWTASFDAIFQNDLQSANLQLAQACRDNSIKNLLPVATINPALPDWQADLIFCEKQLSMSIVRCLFQRTSRFRKQSKACDSIGGPDGGRSYSATSNASTTCRFATLGETHASVVNGARHDPQCDSISARSRYSIRRSAFRYC